MKILHVVHGYHPSVGGSQSVIQNLSEQFVSRYQDEVSVYTTTAYHTEYFAGYGGPVMPPGVETINGVTVRRFEVFTRFRFLRALLATTSARLRLPYNDRLRTLQNGPIIPGMSKAIAAGNADVIMAMAFPLLHMYYALNGAKQAKIPIVFMGAIHAEDRWGYERKMIYEAIQQADAYIALTPFERDYLIERGIAPAKITVAGGGIDPTPYRNADGAAARRFYKLGNDPLIAAVGKQNARKRFDTLLAAMPLVWAKFPNTRCLIAGAKGSASEQISRIIDRLPPEQQHQIIIVDDFPESKKPALLSACDALVLPSGNESFGIVFIEAWACAKPVIGARVGAVESLIDERQDGLLFEYDNPQSLAQAILALLSNSEQRLKMGQAGRKKVLENYTWEIISDKVRGVYKAVKVN